MSLRARLSFLVLAVASALLIPAASAFAYVDVPSSHWAYTQINYVANTNTWMQDYGTSQFKPDSLELRKYLARSLVKMYAAGEPEDPHIRFADIPLNDYWYHWANIATKLGWMPKYDNGKWIPTGTVRVSVFDRALVNAMDLRAPVNGLANIHEADGHRYTVSTVFPHLVIAHSLGLHINHSVESMDMVSTDPIPRDETAYSLWKAKNLASWQISNLSRFKDITLPTLDRSDSASIAAKEDLTQYALTQVGFPYIWAGEWNAESPSGYCCGYQPGGGLDCSGFVWWVMKRNEGGYNAARFHPAYSGWAIPERSSSQMAQYTTTHIGFSALQVGDLVFASSTGGSSYSSVDHVAIYVGNGWIIHSASSANGPVLDTITSGYYRDHFVYGRRLIGVAPSKRVSTENVTTAGDRI